MFAFLACLSVLFLSSLALYFIFMARATVWPPVGTPGMPPSIWLTVVLLLGASALIEGSRRAIRRGESARCANLLLGTLCLAVLFLGVQVLNWTDLYRQGLLLGTQFAAMFYILTVLHALHVLGGIAALLVGYARAAKGRYTAASHSGLRSVVAYWHFLDVVWIVLVGVLLCTGWPLHGG
jgi:cytochrome c oxidase subunit III